MSRIGIVTDSTCDLGPEALANLDVKMVPLKVLFGEDTYLDWLELEPARFYEMLAAAPALPKTSQPSPAEFATVYRELAESGCDEIVSIHLTGALSGTMASAQLAASESPIPVHLVDTHKVSQALALVVMAAVEARTAGQDGASIARRAEDVSASMRLYFLVDTLEYLVKGGRAGKAQGLAASVLGIKPVLTMNAEGVVEPFRKVKGRKRAIGEIAAHVAAEAASHGPMRAAILHGCLEDKGAELVEAVLATSAQVEFVSEGCVGAVIGTYTGPGALAIAYHPV